ncbi:methyl-accepting chemotaxis protein [Bacillus sp. FJAT-45350]|uniref:methyl-accepting chemotaxis protein n=1 Tax=Bacillus sp. FJAT-45350 TaxID=2011014 RepID=UPI000BB68125|nr:methyl-accepting chemotaxis protein [Bacillus sp. FJAT-45350]
MSFRKNLFTQIIVITTALILLVSAVLGGTSYWVAQKELKASGEMNLMHLVETAIPLLEQLDGEVQKGNLTLEQAQEQARLHLNGPRTSNSEGLLYEYSKSPFTYGDEGYIFAYDSQSSVQVHPSLPVGQDMSQFQAENGRFLGADLYEASIKQDVGERFYEFPFPKTGETQSSNKIAYATYFEPWDWSVIIGAYEDEFYESIQTLGLITIVISISTVLLAGVIIYFLLRKKLQALKTVTKSITEVANGNLTMEEVRYNGFDEIAQTAKAFNQMTGQLKTLVENIQGVGQQTSQASLELSALSEETSASSEVIGSAINEITNGAVTQASDIENMNEGTASVADTMKELTNQNKDIIEITNQSNQAIQIGQSQVLTLQQANSQSNNALNTIEKTVNQLSIRVNDISGIVTTIQQIANQTNLLALNASIEAARAGEHGKGFAVVADEVRKLAEETNNATSEIQHMIQSIENETQISVREMVTTMEISKNLNSAVTDTETQFNTISDTLNSIVKAVNQSSQTIASVDGSIQHLLTGVQNMSAVAETTSASSQEATASVQEQIDAITTISEQAESLNELSDELNSLIRQFKL